MLRTSLLVLLAFCACAPAAALDPSRAVTQYGLEYWDIDRGLPQNAVQAMLQTRDGYLWLGTQEGLARFDGVRFTVFNKRNVPNFPHQWVLSLYEDRDGALWVGTAGGLARYGGGEFRVWTAKDGLANDAVSAIAPAADGALWLATFGGGVDRFDGSTFKHHTARDGLPDDRTRQLLADGNGGFWVTTVAGLAHIGADGIKSYTEGLAKPRLRRMLAEPDGSVLIAGDGGLFRFKDGRFALAFPGVEALAGPVSALLRDRDGQLWVGSRAGLMRVRDGQVDLLSRPHGLSNEIVQTLLEDREGDLWVGTFSGGLNRLKDQRFRAIGSLEGLPADDIWVVTGDGTDGMWIGTQGGGLVHWRDGVRERYTQKDGLPSDRVASVLLHSSGDLWVGSTDAGVARLRNGRFTRYTKDSGLAGEPAMALAEDSHGAVWIAGQGLSRIADGKITRFSEADGLPTGALDALLVAADGTLWIGSEQSGLIRYRDGAFTAFGAEAGLTNLHIMALHEDATGTLWLGTNGGGIARFRGGRSQTITSADGLFDDLAYQILEDGAGKLWISCNRGLYSVPLRELEEFALGKRERVTSLAYGKSDGMRSSEFNGGSQPAGAAGPGGSLWFPSVKGLVLVEPQKDVAPQPPPAVVIEQVVVDGAAVAAGAALAPGASRVEFHYTGLALRAPERVRFRYRLEGLEQNWTEAGAQRVAHYTRLPPGSFTFRVSASAEDGAWSEPGTAFAIVQRPFFWQTAWFWIIAAVLASVLLWAVHERNLRQVRARHDELERIVAERTTELAVANAQLERMSRTDPVTAIANRRQLDERLVEEWRRCSRQGVPLALVLADIDHFKPYNDHYGHPIGDTALQVVADVLSTSVRRPGDLIARYGGEEFALVLPDTDAAGAARIAEEARHRLEARALPHARSPLGGVVTISLGVAAMHPDETAGVAQLVTAADAALYRAKAAGRNRVESDAAQRAG